MNPICEDHKEPFETIEVTEAFILQSYRDQTWKVQIFTPKLNPLQFRSLCLDIHMPQHSFQFVSFLKLVQFPLHCTQMFISFTRLTKNIDFGHERVLSREVREVYKFFFFLTLSALKCHLSCLLFQTPNKKIYLQPARGPTKITEDKTTCILMEMKFESGFFLWVDLSIKCSPVFK